MSVFISASRCHGARNTRRFQATGERSTGRFDLLVGWMIWQSRSRSVVPVRVQTAATQRETQVDQLPFQIDDIATFPGDFRTSLVPCDWYGNGKDVSLGVQRFDLQVPVFSHCDVDAQTAARKHTWAGCQFPRSFARIERNKPITAQYSRQMAPASGT